MMIPRSSLGRKSLFVLSGALAAAAVGFAVPRAGVAVPSNKPADATTAAQDWPQFRGPKRDSLSTETGLLKQWPAGGPPLAWKATGLGKGYGTVSVANGRIYTTGDQSDGG